MKITAVLLAAGKGTRMRSNLPKVLHPLMGHPLIHHALEAAQAATTETPVLVIGHSADRLRQAIGDSTRYVLQDPQLGTGHAVQQTEGLLRGQTDLVLVTYGDMPLLTNDTLNRVVQAQQTHSGPMTMLTVIASDPRGFGRIQRDSNGNVLAVVEEPQATPEQLAIRELNPGVYCFQADWLWEALRRIPLSPKGEYYLTDIVEIAVKDDLPVQAIVAQDATELIGINTRIHLAEAEALMRQRINEQWMLSGVTLVDPANTYIEPGVIIGQDTVIWPNTFLHGKTTIGESCILGPNSIIRDSQIGNFCKVLASGIDQAILEEQVDIGPFGNLRRGTHLAKGVHLGNFGEVKNSYLGPGTKVGHFSYIGDASIGANVNIGAGTITCNYDGEKKNPTEIGDGAFIGSDTMLVAPVKVGEGARTGAGAVVTKNVPPNTLAVGVPARVIRKLKKSS
jgi:bifunctional UDP-N-acetylglucosamine pyrophosphorylase/glucosamine-1-phosphate N-acetyltransferase